MRFISPRFTPKIARMDSKLSHLDEHGNLKMVDVGRKPSTARRAVAFGSIIVGEKALELLKSGMLAKGDAWAASRVAAILAAKRTPEIIPLTHPVRLDAVNVFMAPFRKDRVVVFVEALATDRTGVEMEAMVAVSTALLNIYDMTKSVSKGGIIEDVRLLAKSGGKSGAWHADGIQLGEVAKVALGKSKGTPKDPCDEAEIKTDWGLDGDAHAGAWHRQISLLSVDSINKMREKGLQVDFGSFAENIATRNICLYELPLGAILFTGHGIIMEVTQIGKECHTRCAVYHKAGDCVMPREGIFTRVINGGKIKTGDEIMVCLPAFLRGSVSPQ